MRIRFALLIALSCRHTQVERPQLTVDVRDADGPIQGARLMLVRVEHTTQPSKVDAFVVHTDEAGQASFSRLEATSSGCRNDFIFRWCVDHPGYAPVEGHVYGTTATAVLEPGVGGCRPSDGWLTPQELRGTKDR